MQFKKKTNLKALTAVYKENYEYQTFWGDELRLYVSHMLFS